MSFYSPIDRLAQTLPRPKGTGAEFMTELSKMPGYKTQEAEDRGLQALVNLSKMERAQFLEALKSKPPVTPETRMFQTPHHEDRTLPGGENYREFVLRHPKEEFEGVEHHFGGTPNILASVRAKDRTGPNGEKILHLEELQSDWHQQGRKHGYRPAGQSKKLTGEPYKVDEDEYGIKWSDGSVEPDTYSENYANRLAALGKLTGKVPDAPFKKNWHEMALKKMIHHAAKSGYDSIAITPGAEQADRYGFLENDKRAKGMKGFYDKIVPNFLNQFGKKYGAKVGQGKINIDDPNGHSQTEMLRASGIPEQNWGQLSYPQTQQMMSEYSAKQPPKMAPVHIFPITPEMREDVTKNGVPLYADGGLIKNTAIHLKGLGKFFKQEDPLASHIPERTNSIYALHPDKWESTFFSLTNKDPRKLRYFKPEHINVPEGTLVGDMIHANRFYGAKTNDEKQKHAQAYRESLKPYPVDLSGYRMPELLIPQNKMKKGGSVEDEEPKKTVKAYKLFRVHPKHPGKLFPLFVDANTPVEMDKWIDAKEGEMAKGKVKSKIGPLAYRPGWHAGDLPIATHIGEKSDPSLTAPDVRPENHAWAEVEMPDDVDWQAEATKRGTNAQGRVIPVKAHITDQIPKGGHYRYKTNPNMTGNWLIGGSMKVNRVLTDKEVAKINKAAGLADLPRAQPFKGKKFGFAGGGTVAPDEWKAEAHVNHMADGGPVPPLRPLNPQLAAAREQMAQQSALHKAYDEAMKSVYTNQMPTFAQWVALQGKAKGGEVSRETHDANLAKFLSDSKVKDRLYHATPADFKEFKPGGHNPRVSGHAIWLGSDPSHLPAAHHIGDPKNPKSGVQTMPVHVQAKKPMVLDDKDMLAWAQAAYAGGSKEFPELMPKEWADKVKEDYDSIIHADPHGRGDPHEIIMFDPRKIKSAIGNRGTYDSRDPDMTKAKGGAVKPVGYTKERVTVSPNLDAMRYELESVKHYSKKVK